MILSIIFALLADYFKPIIMMKYEEIDVNNYIGSVIRVNRAQERFRLEPLLEEQKFDFDAKLFR